MCAIGRMRCSVGVVLAAAVGLCGLGGGCGDRGARQRSDLAYNIDAARTILKQLDGYLDKEDFGPESNGGAAYDIAQRSCVMMLPRLAREKAPERVRSAVVAKSDELRQAFRQGVDAPLRQRPPNLQEARQGVARCLTLLDELEAALG
jgi:hypothetical protein